jgi:hypothetical protein
MSECKFKNPACTPLHGCEEERAEFDRVLLDVKMECVPSSVLVSSKHCVQMVPKAVRERYDLTQPSEYRVLVARLHR